MFRSSRGRFVAPLSAIALTSALLGFAPAASATPASAAHTTLSEALTGEARASYESAKLLFADGDYAGAAGKYRAAYESSHDARLLWNMAACEKELRHYARASALVDRFLAEGAATFSPDLAEQARITRDALQRLFSLVTLTVRPDGAEIRLDGVPIGHAPLPAPIPMDDGERVVRVEKAGFTPVEVRYTISRPVTLQIDLKPVDTAATLAVLAPDEDTVNVDGRPVGRGAWTGQLPPGHHRLVVSDAKQKLRDDDLDLKPGEHRSVEVTVASAKSTLVWPWVAGGVALAAGAVVAGYFLFKPTNSVGPPPDGLIGTVYVRGLRLGH